MSTHNICFNGEITKDISIFWMKKTPYLLLCLYKWGIQIFFFYFITKIYAVGTHLKYTSQCTSNKYPQHMFLLRINKNSISFGWSGALSRSIATDKSGYPHNIFLFSP